MKTTFIFPAELAESVISAANAEHYATLVRNKSLQRSLIGACSDIISNCYDASQDIEQLLDHSESSIFSISERTTGKVFKSSKELVSKVFEDLEKRVERKELVTGVTTGYFRLDSMTAGLQPSDLIIIAARPSMGKTAFVLNMAMRAAVNAGTPVAIYSLEMSMESLMMRMLCAWGKVDLGKLRKGFLDDEDWAKLYAAADVLSRAPIYIDDTPAITTLDLRARTRRLPAAYAFQPQNRFTRTGNFRYIPKPQSAGQGTQYSRHCAFPAQP
jgi:replicative DNA helicase